MSKIIIVGANHAGTACANTILDNYPNAQVTIYDRNNNISFLGCGMALWIGNQIDGADGLFYSSAEKLREKGAEVFMEAEVTKLDPAKKQLTVKFHNGEEKVDTYDKLVLATGSLPFDPPSIQGLDLENVFHVKIYQDAAAIIETLKDKPIDKVTVVGAGYIGVELAEAFERHHKKVTLIDAAETCLSTYYDKSFTALMEKNLNDHGIDCHYGECVKELLGKNGKVTAVETDKGKYETDLAVLCIGFRPNTQLAKEHLKCFKNGAYVVNRNQQTSNPDIYAIGDCATLWDNSINDTNYIALATNAVRSGVVAGHNVCGTKLESIGVQGSNGINIYELKMVSTGLTLAKAEKAGIEAEVTEFEDLQKPAFMKNENAPVKLRVVYRKDNRKIIGAQIASTYDISMGIHLFSLAIQEGVTIDKLALTDIFFLPHFNQPYNYITMAALTAK